MPPKKTNEEENFSLFDGLPEEQQPQTGGAGELPDAEPLALNFDIFNFSMEELRAAEKARREAEAREEAEPVYSLFDELDRGAPTAETEELTAETEELPRAEEPETAEELPEELSAEAEVEELPVEEILSEDEESTAAEVWPEISAEAEGEALTAEPLVSPDEEQTAEDGFEAETEAVLETAAETEPAADSDAVEEALPPEIITDEAAEELPAEDFTEPEEEELPAEENAPEDNGEEKDRASLAAFLSLFRRKSDPAPPEETPEAGEEPVDDAEAAEKKPGKLSMDKEKLFAMLYPKKKETEPVAETEAPAEPGTETTEEEPTEERAIRVTAPAAVTMEPGFAQLPREPKPGEMLVYDTELDDIDYYDDEDLPELRDYMPVRFARYGKLGIGGGLMYALFVISVSVILACAGWLFASDVLALNKPDTTSVVTILRYVPGPEDTLNEDGDPVDEDGRVIQVDMDQVASALKSSGVIDFKWLFKLFGEVSNANVKINPGTYDVSAKLDYRALVTEMQVGSESQEITRITFPEGYTMEQIFQLLEDNGICDKDDLYEAAANHDYSYDWLEGLPLGDASRLEGYLFPDTYDFYQGENAINAIDRFLNRFHYMLTLDMLTQAENRGISLHEAVIIASLIEKEAGAEDDRSRFASVIYNRLRDGWKLQLDSTLNYIKGTSTFDLTYDDMEIDSPYNTYLYEGLPAGPICSPGKASIVAALNPASTNDWFWYAHEGVTYFFSSSSAFNEFAAAHPY